MEKGFVSCTTIVGFATLPLHIGMIIIGVKYKDECPVEIMIPIYLIVAGAAGILSSLYSCGMLFRKESDEVSSLCLLKRLHTVMQLLLLAWFACGNVWIYNSYQPNYTDPTSPKYCHEKLYLFAFWATFSHYFISFIVMICGCCIFGIGCIFYIFKWSRKDYDMPRIFLPKS
ncbi:uncharacterized protein LOC111326524 [Stylophora pistillata]|uniref:uncharacterized protein LOC111326524 n=1 Tax=Stylophora pistillata TaxID=50429 RepID=UPI000C046416|nr:uncharacterized protein LOC111326524 [Stylophora pistillata]XP_022786269.1 uncharacterized protein LOC111326524 [Stylophora pistillata]